MIRAFLVALLLALEAHPQRAVIPVWCYCLDPGRCVPPARLEAGTRVELLSVRGMQVRVGVLEGEHRGLVGYVPFNNLRIDP